MATSRSCGWRLTAIALAARRRINSPIPGVVGLSREHLVIEREGARWVARDLGSTNGSLVNGERISEPRILRSGRPHHGGPSDPGVPRGATTRASAVVFTDERVLHRRRHHHVGEPAGTDRRGKRGGQPAHAGAHHRRARTGHASSARQAVRFDSGSFGGCGRSGARRADDARKRRIAGALHQGPGSAHQLARARPGDSGKALPAGARRHDGFGARRPREHRDELRSAA